MSRPPQDHLEQARQNRTLAYELLAQGMAISVQWAVIAAFYCSVHCVDAHLSQQGITVRTHAQRFKALAATGPTDVYAAHEQVSQLSREARYELVHFSRDWVRATVFDRYLARVTAWSGLPPV